MGQHVQFNEENQNSSVLYGKFERSNQPPGMVNMLMKMGVVKSANQAKYVLLGLVVILVLIMMFALSSLTGTNDVAGPDPGDDPSVTGTLR
jgi:hypothetical protein